MSILKTSTRSLVIGGLFFMLPLLIIILAGGKIIQILLPVGRWLSKTLALHSVFGAASVLIACLFLILLICFFSGLLIQKGFVRKWSDSVEEKLFIHFPSLQMLKFRIIGDQENAIYEFWHAILLEEDNSFNIAFITEESDDFITVFIPDAPKADAGEVRYIKKSQAKYYPITMQQAMSSLYGFGKGMHIEEKIKSKAVKNPS